MINYQTLMIVITGGALVLSIPLIFIANELWKINNTLNKLLEKIAER